VLPEEVVERERQGGHAGGEQPDGVQRQPTPHLRDQHEPGE
jgi:hypothetical protein